MKIQPIVEGHGEVQAVSQLLRRMGAAAGLHGFDVGSPIRRRRSQLVAELELRKSIQLAPLRKDCGGILILFDGDDDCPKELAPRVQEWAQSEARATPCEVVIAHREFEAWFLAAMESLRGVRGIRANATSHLEPETPRDAKGQIEERMVSGCSYAPAIDQAALAARFDMGAAYARCRSFRRFVTAFGITAAVAGANSANWPPRTWPNPP